MNVINLPKDKTEHNYDKQHKTDECFALEATKDFPF